MRSTPSTTLEPLRQLVRASALNRPGIYRMLGETGEVLYVGKSKQVRTRLLSYFRAREGEKAFRILREAKALEWEYEPSEFAALLREMRLIKELRPRYNVQHKRDRRYSFLKLTAGMAPKLLVVHAVADDAAEYYGPFRGGRRISEAVRELNDVLGLRDCALTTRMNFADQEELFELPLTPGCHRAEVRLCSGPCAALCTAGEYLHRVDLARRFLEGSADEPLLWLDRRMQDAAERWDFEYAAILRDRAQRLASLRDDFSRLREAVESLSFVYSVPGQDGEDRMYVIRRGTVRETLAAPRTPAERRRVMRRATEIFQEPEVEGSTVPRHQIDEILLIARWFRAHPRELENTTAVPHTGALPRSA